MEKSCETCYWSNSHYCRSCNDYFEFDPICNECDTNIGEYEYENKFYCVDCMMKELGIKKEEIVLYEYYIKDALLGNSFRFDSDEVIFIVNNKVKKL